MLHKHADKVYHKEAIVRSEEFLRFMTHQQPDIQSRLNQAMAEKVSSNRLKLTSICGRQNIALRGHRDNATNVKKDTLDTENHGNFWALLNFRVDAGDTVLGEHLASAPRNATYTSSIIQNQIIDILAHQIRQKIIRKVQGANWFSVVADEVTDVSNKEELSLVLRYVDPDTLLVREDLVGFFECDTRISCCDLAGKITST